MSHRMLEFQLRQAKYSLSLLLLFSNETVLKIIDPLTRGNFSVFSTEKSKIKTPVRIIAQVVFKV